MKFGNLVSYTGKYLSTAKAKSTGGNLVFAKITGSTTLAKDHADYDKDGFYIFTPGATGLMVTKEDFNALKKEVKDLQTKVGNLVIGEKTYATVPEYVAAYVTSKITTSVRNAATATDEVVPTEKAVRTAIDAAVSNLGTVMEFVGVTTTDVTAEGADAVVEINGKSKTAEIGDVVVYGNEEYVWDGAAWHEIGQVKPDEAVTSLGDVKGDVKLGTALKIDATSKVLDVKLAETQGNVTLDTKNGLKASVTAGAIAYAAETLEGESKPTTEAENVKDALNDLFRSDKVASAAINDLNSRLDTLSGVVGAVEHTTVSDGDTTDFVTITETAEGSHKNYAISATLVRGKADEAGKPTDTGIATDAYVRDTVEAALTWEILSDAAGE